MDYHCAPEKENAEDSFLRAFQVDRLKVISAGSPSGRARMQPAQGSIAFFKPQGEMKF